MNIKTNWLISVDSLKPNNNKLPTYIFENGIHLYQDECLAIPKLQPLTSPTYKRKAIELFKKIVEEQGYPDIIHAHITYPGGYIGAELSKLFKVPLIVTEHASYFSDQLLTGLYKRYSNLVLNEADLYTAVSTKLAEDIKSHGREDCIVIPNFINVNDFKLKKSKTNRTFSFVNIAAMRHIKGIDTLLKAIKILVFDLGQKNFSVDFIGGGSDEQKYRRMAMDFGISNWCNFHGNVIHHKIPTFLEKSDALVISSRFETFGIAGIEAMACGLPVISTDCGGPRDFINNNTGMIIKDNTPEELANGMLTFMNIGEHWDSKNIREYVEQYFSTEAVSKKILGIYHNLASK